MGGHPRLHRFDRPIRGIDAHVGQRCLVHMQLQGSVSKEPGQLRIVTIFYMTIYMVRRVAWIE